MYLYFFMLSIKQKWMRGNIYLSSKINYLQYRKCNGKRNLVYEMRVFIGMVLQVMEPTKNINVKVDVVDDVVDDVDDVDDDDYIIYTMS
jgi:hypothetical protein